MLSIYRETSGPLRQSTAPELPGEVIWMDLLNPTADEIAFVEQRAGIRVPTAEALSEVEASSRLQVERGVLYLSAPIVAGSQAENPVLSPAGFILSPRLLVTVRFTPLSTFDTVAERIRVEEELCNSVGVFTALMEAIVDRGADVLEHLGAELDRLSRSVFRGDPNQMRHPARSNEALRLTLSHVGDIGIAFRSPATRCSASAGSRTSPPTSDRPGSRPSSRPVWGRWRRMWSRSTTLRRNSANKVQLLLDAVLGFITIAQNDLFKVLTIVSVVGIRRRWWPASMA